MYIQFFEGALKMKEENGNEKKKPVKNKKNGEKKFYLFTAIGCAVALLAIIIVAVDLSIRRKRV